MFKKHQENHLMLVIQHNLLVVIAFNALAKVWKIHANNVINNVSIVLILI